MVDIFFPSISLALEKLCFVDVLHLFQIRDQGISAPSAKWKKVHAFLIAVLYLSSQLSPCTALGVLIFLMKKVRWKKVKWHQISFNESVGSLKLELKYVCNWLGICLVYSAKLKRFNYCLNWLLCTFKHVVDFIDSRKLESLRLLGSEFGSQRSIKMYKWIQGFVLSSPEWSSC